MIPEGVPTTKTQTKMNLIVKLNNEKGLLHDPRGGAPTTKTQTKIHFGLGFLFLPQSQK
jgi:hypothetical protein